MSDYPEKIHTALRAVHGKIMHVVFSSFRDIGLTPPQAITLCAAGKLGDGATVSEVCKDLNTPLSNTTNIVLRLESMGLITKERDESDRRKVKLYLTERGKDALIRSQKIYGELNGEMSKALSPEQQNTVLCGLELLDGFLDAYLSHVKTNYKEIAE